MMEASNPTYVRRRCGLHLSWRVTDAGIDEMTSLKDGMKHGRISAYLRDGITWNRLQNIAVSRPDQGGLHLFDRDSAEHAAFMRPSPPSVVEDRPESDYEFLRWLMPRQQSLARLINIDTAQRNLTGSWTRTSRETLNNAKHCILRLVDVVLLRKGLFGYFWTRKHKRLAGNLGFDEFVGCAIHVITSTKLDRYVLGALGLSWSDLDLVDGQDCNIPWVAIAKKLCGGRR